MKKILSVALAVIMYFAVAPCALAADSITVTVNGERVVFDQEPINVNGRVMVPVRRVAEKMGWEVGFETYANESHVTFSRVVMTGEKADYSYETDITLDTKTIICGNSGFSGEKTTLKVNPMVTNGRTLLGIRDIAEGLYADIEWIGATKTVAITTIPVEEYSNYDKLSAYMDENEKTTGEENETEVTAVSQLAEEVIRLTNEEREKAGLKSLEANSALIEAADIRAGELPESFSHTRPDGTICATAAREAGFSGNAVGENIAGGQTTPEEVVTDWMNSEGHRANILSSKYKYIGTGYISGSPLGHYWVQVFGG